MAEQAINTIYLLGEQPDALCGEIIKSFTRAIFTLKQGTPVAKDPIAHNSTDGSVPPSPVREHSALAPEAGSGDTAEAFHLSQLVFTVGHVAFKHIVYLELVEREIKRRKEVLAKGS